MFTLLLDWLGAGKYNISLHNRDYRKVLNWMPYERKLMLSQHREGETKITPICEPHLAMPSCSLLPANVGSIIKP
jgi:hypothetical protein